MGELQAVVEAARRDPNTFIEYVLDVTQADLHHEVQAFYTDNDDCGVGLPRGHGKTTQTLGRVAWEIGREVWESKAKRSPRWKYIQATTTDAGISVDLVRRIVESPRYSHVFPGLVPDPTVWGKQAFRFQTESLQRDPALQACTIFGHAGGRATDMVFDDVCTLENAVRRSGLREQVKEAYRNTWLPMLTGDRKRVWRIFTPWHAEDITADWRKGLSGRDRLLWRPCHEFDSPWPEGFSAEWLQEQHDEEMGPIAYARAYLLEPLDPSILIWPSEWLEGAMYDGSPTKQGYVAMAVDFAFTEKRQAPAHGDPDFSTALVARIDHKGHVWLLDMLRVQATFPEFKRAALALGRMHGCSVCRAEAVAGQRGLVQQMHEDATFPVEPIERVKDKVTRASSLQAFVKSGRFHIPGGEGEPDPRFDKLYEEMVLFPTAKHDDTVDAAMDMMELALRRPGQFGGSRPQVTRITAADPKERLSRIYGRT